MSKKITLTILFFIFITFWVQGQNPVSVSAKVSSEKMEQYINNGRVLDSSIAMHWDGSQFYLYMKNNYFRDSEGKIIKRIFWYNSKWQKTIYNYYDDGSLKDSLRCVWNTLTEDWSDTVLYMLYDQQGRLLVKYTGTWIATTGTIENRRKYRYTYDDTLIKEIDGYIYSNNTWELNAKSLYEYDSAGQLIKLDYLRVDASLGILLPYGRLLYKYDEYGHLIDYFLGYYYITEGRIIYTIWESYKYLDKKRLGQYRSYYWDIKINGWHADEGYDIEYNGDTTIRNYYEDAGDSLKPTTRAIVVHNDFLETYDSTVFIYYAYSDEWREVSQYSENYYNGLLIYQAFKGLFGGVMTTIGDYSYVYDGTLLVRTIQRSINYLTGELRNSTMYRYYYDSQGRKISEYIYKWDDSLSVWAISKKDTFAYKLDGRFLYYASLSFDPSGIWDTVYSTSWTYDQYDNLIKIYRTGSYRSINYYYWSDLQSITNTQSVDNGIIIYPNPAKYTLTVLGLPELESVEILNIKGQTIKRFDNMPGAVFPVQDLSPGTYILQMKTKDGIYSRKFIKL